MLKFGLTTYFKNPLMTAVNNAGPFVLMFDESLNAWLIMSSLVIWITVRGTFNE